MRVLQTPKPVKQHSGGGAAGAEVGIPLEPVVQTMVRPKVE